MHTFCRVHQNPNQTNENKHVSQPLLGAQLLESMKPTGVASTADADRTLYPQDHFACPGLLST